MIQIWTKAVRHVKSVRFQLPEAAVPRALFAANPVRIGLLRAAQGRG